MSTTGGLHDLEFIAKRTDEFRNIEYVLKLSLANARLDAETVDAWALSNPKLEHAFRQKYSQSVIHGWLPASHFSAGQLSNVAANGVTATSLQPLRVIYGALQRKDSVPRLKGTQQYIYCKVAVGRSYPIKAGEAENGPIPPGFDSNYLCGASTSFPDANAVGARKSQRRNLTTSAGEDHIGNDGETVATSNFHHEYVIAKSAQILPVYLVRFTVTKSWYTSGTRICQGCEEAAATLHCEKCEAVMCDVCDHKTHTLNKITQRHLRQPVLAIQDNQPIQDRLQAIRQTLGSDYDRLACCPVHKSQQIEYYDPVLNVPVCVHCKMVGSHSSGAAANHRLISINEAYERVGNVTRAQCCCYCVLEQLFTL